MKKTALMLLLICAQFILITSCNNDSNNNSSLAQSSAEGVMTVTPEPKYLKELPEINYFNEIDDVERYCENNGFSEISLGDEWTGVFHETDKFLSCAALDVKEKPSVSLVSGGFDKRWELYAGFSIFLGNPITEPLSVNIIFNDTEGGNEYIKNIILEQKSDIRVEIYEDELRNNEIDPSHVDGISIEADMTGTFSLNIDELALIPRYSGSQIHTFKMDQARSDANYDKYIAAVTLQGLVNRTGPRLAMLPDDNVMDTIWLDLFRKNNRWLAGYDYTELDTFESLIDTFIDEIAGVVIWDEDVPATMNVASTMAGIYRTIPVRFDNSEGSPYHYLVEVKKLPVIKDLRNIFTGSGNIPDINRKSTVSSKADAYAWALEMFLNRNLLDPGIMAQMRDGYFDKNYPNERKHVHDRDYVVMRKGFFFDLNCWPDDVSTDDPGQPAGTDYKMAEEILGTAYEKSGKDKAIEVIGYISWHHKYSDKHNDSGIPGFYEFPTEYQNIMMLTTNNAVLNASEGSPNVSFYSQGEKIDLLVQNPPAELPQLDQSKTYILYMIGDFDGAYGNWGNWRWNAPERIQYNRKMPVAYSFNPQVQKYLPDLFRYYYETKSQHDYFVGSASGLGYVLSSSMSDEMARNYANEGMSYYFNLGYKIANFNISGYVPSDKILKEYARLGLIGYAHNGVSWRGWIDNPSVAEEKLVDRMVVNNLISIRNENDKHIQAAQDIRHWVDLRWGRSPGHARFLTVRVFQDWTYAKQLEKVLNETYPDYNFEFVDPNTYYALFRQFLGGSNDHIQTFTKHDIPKRAEKGNNLEVNLQVRNDGTDIWSADAPEGSRYGLSVKLISSSDEIADETIVYIENDISRGKTADFVAVLHLPDETGDYHIVADMLCGDIRFGSKQNQVFNRPIRISAESDELPEATSLRAPIHNQVGTHVQPVFQWTESFGALSYTLTISKNPDLSDPEIVNTGIEVVRYRLDQFLERSIRYYWSVSAVNKNGSTDAIQKINSFTTN
ncbi:hypothetical protein EOM86_01375 [Candidatus Nomurabacteria bacterium]|nr:hypothetical protein [Candidatus Nomurabacteria bacterium]